MLRLGILALEKPETSLFIRPNHFCHRVPPLLPAALLLLLIWGRSQVAGLWPNAAALIVTTKITVFWLIRNKGRTDSAFSGVRFARDADIPRLAGPEQSESYTNETFNSRSRLPKKKTTIHFRRAFPSCRLPSEHCALLQLKSSSNAVVTIRESPTATRSICIKCLSICHTRTATGDTGHRAGTGDVVAPSAFLSEQRSPVTGHAMTVRLSVKQHEQVLMAIHLRPVEVDPGPFDDG
jgi:hypothetical protein